MYWLIWEDKSDYQRNSVLEYAGLANQFWLIESALS